MSRSAPKKHAAKLKRSKTGSRSSHQVGLGLMVLFFLILLILVGKFFTFIQSLNQAYSPDGQDKTKKYSWDGKGEINLAVKADSVYVLSFDPLDQLVNLIRIPDDTYMSLPFGYGRWAVSSVYQLGQNEQPEIGGKLLKATLSNSLGVPIDDYLIASGNFESRSFEEVIKDLRQNPVSGLSLLQGSKTDLSAVEYWHLVWGIKGVRPDKVKLTDLGKNNLTYSLALPDGSKVLGISQVDFDQYVEDRFEDNRLKNEGLSVGIFNATDHPGLAEKAARLITNAGGRVVFTTNSADKQKNNLVVGKPSVTTTRLTQLFAPDCLNQNRSLGLFKSEKNQCLTKSLNVTSSRADINVVLGEDYFNQLNEKQTLSH
jgi:hypothetical protein